MLFRAKSSVLHVNLFKLSNKYFFYQRGKQDVHAWYVAMTEEITCQCFKHLEVNEFQKFSFIFISNAKEIDEKSQQLLKPWPATKL